MNSPNNAIALISQIHSTFTLVSALTSHVLDASTEKLAWSFVARETTEITAVNAYLRGVGAPSADIILSIQSDNANKPSGTVLGATNNAKSAAFAFAPGAAYAWTGEQALSETTGALTINTRYWLVMEISGTPTLLDGSNYYQTCMKGSGLAVRSDAASVGYYTGGAWTVGSYQASFVLKRGAGVYTGLPTPQAVVYRGTNNIWCDSDTSVDWRQGIRYKVGVQHYCAGIRVYIDYVGTPPEGLIFDLFEESTLKQSTVEIEPALVAYGDTGVAFFQFSSFVLLSANTNIYIIGRQATSTGGAAANSYAIPCIDVSDNNYAQCLVDPDMNFAFVHGSGSDPTSFTVEDAQYVPFMIPCITNIVDDLTCPAGGGGSWGF